MKGHGAEQHPWQHIIAQLFDVGRVEDSGGATTTLTYAATDKRAVQTPRQLKWAAETATVFLLAGDRPCHVSFNLIREGGAHL
jgi:translation initiation factor IF-2